MKTSINECHCITKLQLLGYVLPFDSTTSSEDIEDGTLCLVKKTITDETDYDQEQIFYNIVENYEYYPIERCPICGKNIDYTRREVKKLSFDKK